MKKREVTGKIYRLTVVFCLSLSLVFFAFLTPVSAESETYPIDHRSPYYQQLEEFGGAYTDAFTQFLYGEILRGETEISVPRSIRFPVFYDDGNGGEGNTAQFVYNWLIYDCPALFHINVQGGFGYTEGRTLGRVTYVAKIQVSYVDTAESHAEKMQACENAARTILRGIAGNNSLSEAEKALLIHDRLIIWCGYDETNLLAGTLTNDDFTMYGALVNRTAVCQGYSLAYKYLLSKVSIFSYMCTSDEVAHAWNIVYIDGIPYHVDVTHDDPLDEYAPYDHQGRVYHENFLVSDTRSRELHAQAFKGNSTYSYDMPLLETPTDTRYQNAYWTDLDKEVMLIDGEIYYCEIDEDYSEECVVLKDVYGNNVEEFGYDCYLREVEGNELVEFWESYPMPSSLSCGAFDGYFLYSQPDGIYGYHVATGTKWKFFGNPIANNTHEEDYFYSFGCSADGKISYDVYRTELEWNESAGNYRYTEPLVSSQTVTVPLFDVNQDHDLNILDLVKAKKMAAANQRRFINSCGQVGGAESLVMIRQVLLEY